MTYQLTCKVCGLAFTRLTKPRRERSKFGPICSRKECRSELARMAWHNRQAREQRAVALAERKERESKLPFAICQNCQRMRARADMQGDRCKFCPGSVPRLGSQPLPDGYRVKEYPGQPRDPVEAMLRRIAK